MILHLCKWIPPHFLKKITTRRKDYRLYPTLLTLFIQPKLFTNNMLNTFPKLYYTFFFIYFLGWIYCLYSGFVIVSPNNIISNIWKNVIFHITAPNTYRSYSTSFFLFLNKKYRLFNTSFVEFKWVDDVTSVTFIYIFKFFSLLISHQMDTIFIF